MKHYVTENQMLDDLTEIMDELVGWLGNSISLRTPPIEVTEVAAEAPFLVLTAEGQDFVSRQQVETFPIAKLLKTIRDYAFDGLRSANDLDDDLINCQEFVYGLVAVEASPETHDVPRIIGSSVERVVDTASARHTLDTGYPLTIPMVAALAGLDERTVRNLAGKSGDEHLNTEKVDGKAFIRPEVAYEWLVSKRGFVPTKWDYDHRTGDSDFGSPAEFGDFLRDRRELLGLSIDDAVKGTRSLKLDKSVWYKMENGGYFPGLEFTPDLAHLLKVDEKWLTERIMRVFYARQLENLSTSEPL